MTTYKLAFLGFGNVGQALAELLLRKESELAEKYNIDLAGKTLSFRVRAEAPQFLEYEGFQQVPQQGSIRS